MSSEAISSPNDAHRSEVIGRPWTPLEQASAENALRQSEEKYRVLFNSMDEGYCIIQMLYDAEGRPVNWLYLDVNTAFERHNGLKNAQGKTILELTPDIESKWMQFYGRVAETGESTRFEEPSDALGRVFGLNVFRVGEPAERKVAVLFTDITARKREETRREFLLKLSDALRPLEDADVIQEAAIRLTGEHFGAVRVGFAETQPDGEKVAIVRDWCCPGVPSVVGHHRLDDYGVFIAELLHAGQDVIVEDVVADLRLPPAEAARWARLGVRSGYRHPLIKAGRTAAYLFIHHESPRRWHEGEVELVHEVAERTWAAVERARTEAALRESEAKLAAVFEALPVGVSVADKQGNLLLSNREMHRYVPTGLMPSRDDARSWRWRAIHPDGQPMEPDNFPGARALRGEKVLPGVEMLYTQDDGTQVWTQVAAVPIIDADGQAAGQVGVITDIDALKRAGEEVRHSEERLRTLADAVPQIIWANAGDGVANYFNRRWYEYSGLSYEQSYDLGWQAIVHPDDAPRSVPTWQAALASGAIFDTEYRLRGADGEYRWFIGRNVPMRNAGGQVVAWFGTATDIHDLKLAEQEAERARAAAEAAGKAKDHFLAVLSHELRTPLMPITVALAVMAKRHDLPEPVIKVHEMIKRNVELETRFIGELLEVTSIERGKLEVTRKDMDLHQAVERAVEVSASDIRAKEQQLTVTLETTTCAYQGDFARLQQVFWNLLKNASKFTPQGGTIEIRSRCLVGDQFVVEVIDTGIGLDAEAIERIFHPFEQASVDITREFGGMGLGLAIANATVEAHGGTLRASSAGHGQGATFTVSLPLKVMPEDVSPAVG